MHSTSLIFAVLAALAVGIYGQDGNMTMPDPVAMDTNTTMMVPPAPVDPVMGNDTDNATMPQVPMATDATPVDNTDNNMTDTMTTAAPQQPAMTTQAVKMTTEAANPTTQPPPPATTTVASNCKTPTERLDEVFRFTTTDVFNDLAPNTQILIYEVLAAAEGCKMTNFITPETAERIFRMLGELPTRYVFIFASYLATALQNEGVAGPS